MKKLMALLMLAVSIPVIAAEIPSSKPEHEGMSSKRLQRIKAMNDRYTETGKIPGTLTAVVRNGKIVHKSASGLKTTGGDPIEMDDLFRIYSMSKPITATAAMQLYEDVPTDRPRLYVSPGTEEPKGNEKRKSRPCTKTDDDATTTNSYNWSFVWFRPK